MVGFEHVAVGSADGTAPTFRKVYGDRYRYVASGWWEDIDISFRMALWNKLTSAFDHDEAQRLFRSFMAYQTYAVIPSEGELILTDEDGNPTELPDSQPQVTCRKEDVIKITWIDLAGDPFP